MNEAVTCHIFGSLLSVILVPCTLLKALMANERVESLDVIFVEPFRHSCFVGCNRFPTGKNKNHKSWTILWLLHFYRLLLKWSSFLVIPDVFFHNVDALEQRNVLRDQVGEVDKAWTVWWFTAQQNDLKKKHIFIRIFIMSFYHFSFFLLNCLSSFFFFFFLL